MANSASTIEYVSGSGQGHGAIKKIKIAWTSDDSDGTVTATTAKISGELLKGVTDPGATAPTANYDIVITDEAGANVLGGCQDDLTDRHTSNTESVDFFLTGTADVGARPVVCDKLTISVSAAGNSKTGQVIIYYR